MTEPALICRAGDCHGWNFRPQVEETSASPPLIPIGPSSTSTRAPDFQTKTLLVEVNSGTRSREHAVVHHSPVATATYIAIFLSGALPCSACAPRTLPTSVRRGPDSACLLSY